MAGSPIKRARRLGLDVPNLGDRQPLHPVRARARETVPGDPELATIAKGVLLDIAENGETENARVGAARALLEATRPRPGDSASLDQKRFSDELERMPAEELAVLEAQAKRVLGS
jgi:hypothetical protein